MGHPDVGFGMTVQDMNCEDLVPLYNIANDMGMEFATATLHNSFYFRKTDNKIDDKLKVAEEDWVTTESGKVLKTLGKINSYYALKTYGVNAQPYYVLIDQDGSTMADRSYDLDVEGFIEFLQSGVDTYKSNK